MRKMIGVLALQGAFAKHIETLRHLGVGVKEVRRSSELASCDALIIPGGESTTMQRHLEREQILEPLRAFAQQRPIFGTCAGLILIAKEVLKDPIQPLGLLDVDVERNAFGRQADSFRTELSLTLKNTKPQQFPAFFIRAPRIRRVGSNVKVLGSYEGEPVLVREGNFLGATFHPELTTDLSVHAYFLAMLK